VDMKHELSLDDLQVRRLFSPVVLKDKHLDRLGFIGYRVRGTGSFLYDRQQACQMRFLFCGQVGAEKVKGGDDPLRRGGIESACIFFLSDRLHNP